MNKYFALVTLLLVSGKAYAHSHPAVDELTHALEHVALSFSIWLPYVLGWSLAALLLALIHVKRDRWIESRRRIK